MIRIQERGRLSEDVPAGDGRPGAPPRGRRAASIPPASGPGVGGNRYASGASSGNANACLSVPADHRGPKRSRYTGKSRVEIPSSLMRPLRSIPAPGGEGQAHRYPASGGGRDQSSDHLFSFGPAIFPSYTTDAFFSPEGNAGQAMHHASISQNLAFCLTPTPKLATLNLPNVR